MKLSSLLDSDLIFFDIEGENRQTVYTNLISKLSEKKSLPESTEKIVNKMIDREDMLSIAYEKSFAFPHLRMPQLNDLYIVIGILKKPVKLKNNDVSKTQIITAFLISGNTSEIYLMSLSAFTKFLMKNDNSTQLIKSEKASRFIEILNKNQVNVKDTITAEDIMITEYPYVEKNDSISKVLDLYASEKKLTLPVIEQDRTFLGQIDSFDLLGRSIPKYMMLLNNHQFLTSFEPFGKLIEDEEITYVRDFIIESSMIISPETPLIQLTLYLLKKDLNNLFVVKNGKLLGIVTMQEIIKKVLRG